MIDRVGADDEAHRQRPAFGGARLVERAQVARRDEVDAGLAAAAQHQPAYPHIGPAGAGIERVVDRSGDVGRAVEPVLEMHRERREVGRLAGLHHLLHRRLAPATLRRSAAWWRGGAGSRRRGAPAQRRRRGRRGCGSTPRCRPVPGAPDPRRGNAPRGDCRRGFRRCRRDRPEPSRRSTSPLSARLSMKRRRRKRSRSSAGAVAVRAAMSGFSITPISLSSAPFARRECTAIAPG